ncbi:MAG: hypothetical protein QMB63_07100 [Clostridiaceae bacterium]
MEAAEEEVRVMEDQLETLRDPSHVKNNSTKISVSLKAWLELTKTPKTKEI